MKSNNRILNHDNPILRNLLNRYPYFFTQNTDSIHYKYNNTLATVISILKHDITITGLKKILNRPLKIWRIQTEPHENIICYNITIPNIQNISLYQEEEKEDILLAKHSFKEGINQYNNYLELKSKAIISNERFYLEVETYTGLTFQKGFPENDTPKNDIYDHDTALDNIGTLYNLKRRKYQANISETDYPYTHPPFCNSQTEWDYYYETRLRNHIQSYGKVPYHQLMLESIFEITPTVQGRWRQVARMNQDVMGPLEDTKYMASTNWNSNVYDITINLEDLPQNMEIPNPWDINNLLKQTFPISTKTFFQITAQGPKIETKIKIIDQTHLTTKITLKDTIPVISDDCHINNINEGYY